MNSVQKFTSNGILVMSWGSYGSADGQFDNPHKVAVDTIGNVYVADTGNHRIQKFDSNGNFIAKWGSFGSGDGQFNSPYGVGVDAIGNVYVADTGNHRIQKFDSNGNFIAKWGSFGSGDGQFKQPQGVAVDAFGNVYVAEYANHRIQKFSETLPDTTPPTPFSLILPTNGASINKPYPYFSWNASSDNESGLAKYQLYIDGQLSRDNIVNWTAAFPSTALSNGSHSWFIRAWDNAGNYRDSEIRNLTINAGAGKIAFTSDRDGDNEIYVMNTDGSGQTQLTFNTASDWFPAWSPDGLKIVFQSNRDGNNEIYVMNADGTGQTRLTYNTATDIQPNCSPNGSKIVFTSSRDGDNEIYVMNTDGSGQTQLTYNTASDWVPAWSPDGSKIVFTSNRDGDDEIYVMNADGTGQTQLTYNTASDWVPAWSPDGLKIAFHSNSDGDDEIYVMNADGTGQTQLTFNTTLDRRPAWSPDGSKIAFRSDRDGNAEIYVMNADGTGQTDLTNNPAMDWFTSWGIGSVSPNDTTPPVTSVSSSPSSPNGANGWFVNAPSITLSINETGTTYYKWNFETNWTTNTGAFTAPQGNNTLYYYSVDTTGNPELVKSAAFKVDIIPPSVPSNLIATPMSSSQMNLSWNASTDATSGVSGYKIYNAGTGAELVTTSSTSYSFSGLTPNTTHSYYVKTYDAAGNISGQSNTASATTYAAPVSTPPGSNVTVDLGNDIQITFSKITNPGTTTITVSETAPALAPPGFSFMAIFYDISTTAGYTPPITVTLPYDESLVVGAEENLRLFHWENGAWVDVTVSVDTVNNTITGRVTSLSPFGIGYPLGSGYSTGANTNMIALIALLAISTGVFFIKRNRKINQY